MGTGQDLYRKARRLIPGGTQLLSKRPEMFLPEQWPAYYSRAAGAEVWDLDGRHYWDMSYMGIGSLILGAADPDVNAVVQEVVANGSMSTLNAPEEVALAELLCELHPWAQMVRYARSGGESMALAVRIARAKTGRDKVAFCGYHGWHDWYLAANLSTDQALDGHLLPGLAPRGVPRGLTGTALPFHYNQLDELKAIVAQHGRELAAIVMEPLRDHEPAPGFLEGVRALADECGAVWIIDEITAGFRLCCGGAHLLYDVKPDMAVFAKGLSNGYPMAAVIGREAVMQAAQDTFISSTYWTDRIGPAAALATIRKHRKLRVHEHLIRIGSQVQAGWQEAAAQSGLAVEAGGMKPLSHFGFRHEQKQAMRTLYTQLMLDRGFLASVGFYACFAHTPSQIANYLQATQDVFSTIRQAVDRNDLSQQLHGPVAHSGFARLT